jgi:hypothetical protein
MSGASGWYYFVAYQADVQVALDELREREFAERRYYFSGAAPRPTTTTELLTDPGFCEEGAHCILDMRFAQAEGGPAIDGDYVLRPLAPDSVAVVFKTDRPTAADFDAVADRMQLPDCEPWNGFHTVLYDTAQVPAKLAFWGSSGN